MLITWGECRPLQREGRCGRHIEVGGNLSPLSSGHRDLPLGWQRVTLNQINYWSLIKMRYTHLEIRESIIETQTLPKSDSQRIEKKLTQSPHIGSGDRLKRNSCETPTLSIWTLELDPLKQRSDNHRLVMETWWNKKLSWIGNCGTTWFFMGLRGKGLCLLLQLEWPPK